MWKCKAGRSGKKRECTGDEEGSFLGGTGSTGLEVMRICYKNGSLGKKYELLGWVVLEYSNPY